MLKYVPGLHVSVPINVVTVTFHYQHLPAILSVPVHSSHSSTPETSLRSGLLINGRLHAVFDVVLGILSPHLYAVYSCSSLQP